MKTIFLILSILFLICVFWCFIIFILDETGILDKFIQRKIKKENHEA